MGDDLDNTSSSLSLSKRINKQQKAYISCEETQTLLEYYVSSLQVNLKAPGEGEGGAPHGDDSGPQDLTSQGGWFPPKDDVDKLTADLTGGGQDNCPSIALPLADFSRKRQRYQSPLETINECEHRGEEHLEGSLRQAPKVTCNTSSNPAVTPPRNNGNSPRFANGRSLKGGLRMLYHTEMWTTNDEHDCLYSGNTPPLNEINTMFNTNGKEYEVHTPTRETHSTNESNNAIRSRQELMSKMTTIDGNEIEVYVMDRPNVVSSSHSTKAEEDGAITIMPKLSVVDIQRCHASSDSKRLGGSSDMKALYNSALQELRSLQGNNRPEQKESNYNIVPVESGVDTFGEHGLLQTHSGRNDADKHLDMVREKQQRAKELFTKLKTLNNQTIQNIAITSSMVLEASIKKVSLLSRSYSFEPEEVIGITTQMLEELTNLISTTSNQIRQVAKSAVAEGENLGVMPFLSGPRSVSSMFSSTETLMSPARFSSSSEIDSRTNPNTTVAIKGGVSTVTMNAIEGIAGSTISRKEDKFLNLNTEKEQNISSDSASDSECEIFRSSDLISFVDTHNTMPHSCPQFLETREPLTNIMDAELDELPSWQNTNDLMGAGEIIKQRPEDASKPPENITPMRVSINTIKDNLQNITLDVSDSVPIHNISYANNETQNLRNSKTCPEIHNPSLQTSAEHKSVQQNLPQPPKNSLASQIKKVTHVKQGNKQKIKPPTNGGQSKECRQKSPGKAASSSPTQAVNKCQQHASHGAYDPRTKSNASRHSKDSTDTNSLHPPNQQVRNKSGQPIHPSVEQAKNEQKRKSNTLTVKPKEPKFVARPNTDKTVKSLTIAKKIQIANKTLEKNVLNICDKIDVLKSCVKDRNTCVEGNVKVERMAAERDTGEGLRASSKSLTEEKQFHNKDHPNLTKSNASERPMIQTNISNNLNNSNIPASQLGKLPQDTNKVTCGNKDKFNIANRLETPVSSPVVTKEVIKYNTPLKLSNSKATNSNIQCKNTNKCMCIQTKNETNCVTINEIKRTNQRPKRVLTHQEIQSWVNFSHRNNHSRDCPLHLKKHHRQCASPNERIAAPRSLGPKHGREVRRSKSSSPSTSSRSHSTRSKRTKQFIDKSASDTSIPELGSTYTSPRVERTTSQVIIDTLSDAAHIGIKMSLSARPDLNLRKDMSQLSLKSAKEIVSKVMNYDDQSSEHPNGINVTINNLVTSLNQTIDKRSDKRICWDSSTDIPPKCKSSSEETESKILETSSRVLETIAAQLIRKISIAADASSSKDDPETEVSFTSKKSWDLSSSSFDGLVDDSNSSIFSCDSQKTKLSSIPVSHTGHLNRLMDALKSTSDVYVSEHCKSINQQVPSVVAETNHAMAALEDLQALLTSLKGNINETTEGRPPEPPVPPMTPIRKVKPHTRKQDAALDPASSEPEPTIEKCGDTTIITTARAPLKRPSQPQPSPQPIKRQHSSCSSFPTRNATSNTNALFSPNSVHSNATSTLFDRSSFSSSRSSNLNRSHSRMMSARASYTTPYVYANKSYGNFPSKQTRSSRLKQNQGIWLNKTCDVSLPSKNNASEMHCGTKVSDNESVVSSSSCYTSRVFQLAQPKRRYMEATKNEHRHVLKRQYLQRLERRIYNAAEMKKAKAPRKEESHKSQARKRTDATEERTEQLSDDARSCSTEKSKTGSTGDDDVVTSSNTDSYSDEPVSVHYNSPSDESIIAGVNDRQYYHYSDKSDYSPAALDSTRFGEVVYVGVEEKKMKGTPQKCVDKPAQYLKQEKQFVTIDMDTWNVISQNCIGNFQQDEQGFIIQTSISPPKRNEVSISELDDSQEEYAFLEGTTNDEKNVSSFDVHYADENQMHPLAQMRELPQMEYASFSTTEKESCFSKLGNNLMPVLANNYFEVAKQPSGLAIVDEDDASSIEGDTDDGSSVDSVIFSAMEDILDRVAVLSNKDPTRSSRINEFDMPGQSDSEYTVSESDRSNIRALEGWPQFNDSGKIYHPKRSISNEISIELKDDYDSKTLLDVVKNYLSSECESEKCSTGTFEGVEDTSDLQKITALDACGLYEPFSDDSENTEELLSNYNTAKSKSVLSVASEVSYTSARDTMESFPVRNVISGGLVDTANVNGRGVTKKVMSLIDGGKRDVENSTSANVENEREMLGDQRSTVLSQHNEEDQHDILPLMKVIIAPHTGQSKCVVEDDNARQNIASGNCVIVDTKTSQVFLNNIESNNSRKDNDGVNQQSSYVTNENVASVPERLLDTRSVNTREREDATTSEYQSCSAALETVLPQIPFNENANRIVCSAVVPCVSYHSVILSSESEVRPSSVPTSLELPVKDLASVSTVGDLLGALTHVSPGCIRDDRVNANIAFDRVDANIAFERLPMERLLKHFSNVAIPGDQEQQSLGPRTDTLEALLNGLMIPPEPVYYGLYSASSISLRATQVAVQTQPRYRHDSHSSDESSTDSSTDPHDSVASTHTRGVYVTRSVQTDDVYLSWPTLSTSVIREGTSEGQLSESSSNNATNFVSKTKSDPGLNRKVDESDDEGGLYSSVSSPGLLLDTDMVDLPYVSDAERQSVRDLAIYTDVLVGYSSKEKLAELLSTLNAALEEDTDESTDGMETLENVEMVESNRRIIIMSLVSCVLSCVVLGLFSLPNGCEL